MVRNVTSLWRVELKSLAEEFPVLAPLGGVVYSACLLSLIFSPQLAMLMIESGLVDLMHGLTSVIIKLFS